MAQDLQISQIQYGIIMRKDILDADLYKIYEIIEGKQRPNPIKAGVTFYEIEKATNAINKEFLNQQKAQVGFAAGVVVALVATVAAAKLGWLNPSITSTIADSTISSANFSQAVGTAILLLSIVLMEAGGRIVLVTTGGFTTGYQMSGYIYNPQTERLSIEDPSQTDALLFEFSTHEELKQFITYLSDNL